MTPFPNLEEYITHAMPRFEEYMQTSLRENSEGEGTLYEAMAYSLDGGGKRFRPLLMFASAEVAGGELEATFPAAAALEMIHTYSLIHDDLPAMDDDDLRRGKPTNHKIYGEAAAILAGDGLLTAAFGLLLSREMVGEAKSFQLAGRLATAAGARGMVAGQVADIEGEKRSLTLEDLQNVHIKKTGALIEYATESGARIAGADEEVVAALGDYARHLGLAYQIHNDLKDIMLDQEESGKTQGHDEDLEKNTYPSILGTEGALEALKLEREQALAALERIDSRHSVDVNEKGLVLLQELLKYVEF